MDEYRFTAVAAEGYALFELRDPGPGWLDERFEQVDAWCRSQFGPPSPRAPAARWYLDAPSGAVMFRNPSDATAFKLRWC